jgi:Flp pilus assembly protein CpaB
MARDRLFFIFSFMVLGLVAAFLFRGNGVPQNAEAVEATAKEEKAHVNENSFEVLVAKETIKPNEQLNTHNYEWKKISTAEFNQTLVINNDQNNKWLNEAAAARPIAKGETIHYADLIWPETGRKKEEMKILPTKPGMRAIPYTLPPKSGIVQFMNPGMYVDINFTSKSDIGFGTVSVTLLKSIRILGIGQDAEGNSGGRFAGAQNPNAPIQVLLEMSPKQAEIFFYAQSAGAISLSLMDQHVKEQDNPLVEMLLESESVGAFHSVLATYMIRTLFPQVDVNITATPKGYIVAGKVPDPQKAGKIMEILEKLAPGGDKSIVNLMEVEPQQVLLAVKVFEMDNDVRQRLGINWELLFHHADGLVAAAGVYPRPAIGDPNFILNACNVKFGNDVTLNYIIDMLEHDGYAKVIAEPNLTTISGKTAHFFAGGEFPILIPQGGNLIGTVTVEFKRFGVFLSFTPFVDLNGLITLHVIPEVSTVDKTNAVVLSGFVIPSLITRRADSTVKLWSGQSYLIAGLLQNETLEQDDKFFCLDKLPIIGPLFKSKDFREHRSELMVIITPFLIKNENTPVAEDPGYEDCRGFIEPTPIFNCDCNCP